MNLNCKSFINLWWLKFKVVQRICSNLLNSVSVQLIACTFRINSCRNILPRIIYFRNSLAQNYLFQKQLGLELSILEIAWPRIIYFRNSLAQNYLFQKYPAQNYLFQKYPAQNYLFQKQLGLELSISEIAWPRITY